MTLQFVEQADGGGRTVSAPLSGRASFIDSESGTLSMKLPSDYLDWCYYPPVKVVPLYRKTAGAWPETYNEQHRGIDDSSCFYTLEPIGWVDTAVANLKLAMLALAPL